LAFRLAEEISDQAGQFLNAAQRADGQPFHLSLVGDQFARLLAFDVRLPAEIMLKKWRPGSIGKELRLVGASPARLHGCARGHRRNICISFRHLSDLGLARHARPGWRTPASVNRLNALVAMKCSAASQASGLA